MSKSLIMLMASVGGVIGGSVPVLLGSSGISGWSLLGSLVGGVLGIWVGYKLSDY